jgi:ABC-type cobalamin transport system ATPase subunit
LKQADTILVLAGGRIVQRGTHDELVTQEGLYRRIYDLQLRDQEMFALSRFPFPLRPTTFPGKG